MHDPIPVRYWQEFVIDNDSTADQSMATLSSMDASGTVRSLVSSHFFDQAVNGYGFEYPVFEDDNDEEVDRLKQRQWFCRKRKEGERATGKVNNGAVTG